MKKYSCISFCVTFILLCMSLIIAGPVAGEELPSLSLTVPERQSDKVYLGLSGETNEPFAVSDIDADLVIIELLSMYCPYCQKEAPLINQFHELALQQKEKGVTIKMIGIGASNTQFEVDHFREKYSIAFPIFPDQSLEMYDKLKGEGTPGFLVVSLKDGETPKIVFRQLGGFETAENFLEQVLEKSGKT